MNNINIFEKGRLPILPRHHVQDIDTEEDWKRAELMHKVLYTEAKMSKTILVVAAHPDDEVLGCGGTIARHADIGDEVHVLIVAEGATSRQLNRNRIQASSELSVLAKSAQQAGTILGATDVELLDLPDNRLDSLDRLDLIKTIEERLNAYQPQVVYLHHAGDVNVDHRRLHEAVVTACRPTPGQSYCAC